LSAKLVAAQEQERRRIGCELHDEIGQALTAIKVEVALAERDATTPSGCAAALARLRTITDRTLQSVRDVSRLLHPLDLDDLGLPDAMASYVREFSQRTGVKTSFASDDLPARLAPEIEICAYRIVQEALTNVARHAAASRCQVELRKQDAGIALVVEDDGKGFDQALLSSGQAPRGLGLLGMRERVNGLRGDFRLETSPGTGTRLTVHLPDLPAPAGAPDAEAERGENADSPR
jgi:signal transduction histidine kinase